MFQHFIPILKMLYKFVFHSYFKDYETNSPHFNNFTNFRAISDIPELESARGRQGSAKGRQGRFAWYYMTTTLTSTSTFTSTSTSFSSKSFVYRRG